MTTQKVNTMAVTVKVKISDGFTHTLDELYQKSAECVKRMLSNRRQSSSKYYKEIPCVISKSLIAKYQRNPKCKSVKSLVLPICGDKGRQIKRVDAGIRIPAIFKKHVLPVSWPKVVVGHLRSVEFFKRDGEWYASICYNTRKHSEIDTYGAVGVDRNSVGNVAVMAAVSDEPDPQNGKVFKLGISPAPTKRNMRGRRKNLQKASKKKLLSKLRRKQRRRMTYENHRASRSIVDYAARHRYAIAIENLKNIAAKGSKIRRYSESNQWAFAQLETFVRYKASLRGIPLLEVSAAYTSQTCSKCGNIHKPNGKRFSCGSCGHNDHRDANAAFNIAKRGLSLLSGYCKRICDGSSGLSVPELGSIGGSQAGKAVVV